MPAMNPLAIREQISDKHNQAQAIVDLAEQEARELTPEDKTQFAALMANIGEDSAAPSGLYADLRRAEKLEALSLELARKQKPEPAEAPKEEFNIRSLG